MKKQMSFRIMFTIKTHSFHQGNNDTSIPWESMCCIRSAKCIYLNYTVDNWNLTALNEYIQKRKILASRKTDKKGGGGVEEQESSRSHACKHPCITK
jgi:hypothetical protein